MEKRQCVPSFDSRTEETDDQGIPTSRQEEEVNGNSRKGEPGVPGKEGDYIVEWRDGIGCTSLAGHAALRQDCGFGGILSPLNLEQLGLEDRFDAQKNPQITCEGGLAGCRGKSPRGPLIPLLGTTIYTNQMGVGPYNSPGCCRRRLG